MKIHFSRTFKFQFRWKSTLTIYNISLNIYLFDFSPIQEFNVFFWTKFYLHLLNERIICIYIYIKESKWVILIIKFSHTTETPFRFDAWRKEEKQLSFGVGKKTKKKKKKDKKKKKKERLLCLNSLLYIEYVLQSFSYYRSIWSYP